MTSFYDFTVEGIDGNPMQMTDYAGKVVLIVNVATRCGLAPQLNGLEAMWQKYREEGLVVLGCPSNQFAQQPGTSHEIADECRLIRGITFPLTAEMKVNGPHTDPLWKWLKSELPGSLGSGIKWNYSKFLISRQGEPLSRYSPTTNPEKIEGDVLSALNTGNSGLDSDGR